MNPPFFGNHLYCGDMVSHPDQAWPRVDDGCEGRFPKKPPKGPLSGPCDVHDGREGFPDFLS
jgi:hypothetical protein